MMLKVDDRYITKFEQLIASLPKGAVEITSSLDNEITKRVTEYRNGSMQTTPFMEDLESIREKLVVKL